MSRLDSRREKVVDEFSQKEIDYYKSAFNLYIETNWIYSGGNMDSHLEYYRRLYPITSVPLEDEQEFCICGRYLRKERYYLRKITPRRMSIKSVTETYILTVGKCCITPYLPTNKYCSKEFDLTELTIYKQSLKTNK